MCSLIFLLTFANLSELNVIFQKNYMFCIVLHFTPLSVYFWPFHHFLLCKNSKPEVLLSKENQHLEYLCSLWIAQFVQSALYRALREKVREAFQKKRWICEHAHTSLGPTPPYCERLRLFFFCEVFWIFGVVWYAVKQILKKNRLNLIKTKRKKDGHNLTH